MTTTLSAAHRHWLDIQGFVDVDDAALSQAAPWLRLSPALCTAFTALGTAFASPPILWSMAVIAALGAALPFHPFDLIYNLGLRRFTGTPRLPANRAPRRVACAAGSAWLLATGALFATGFDIGGYALGAGFVATAALVTTTHICIPSFLFRTACRQMPPRRAGGH